jgi:SAM-dependent MidA family methyltransferase
MARAAPRAIALFLDYGGAPERLYGEHAPGGTLRGFHQHRVVEPFERPGDQDVTADVDFPWIATLASEAGWAVAGQRPQGEFLADLGLVDDLMGALQRGDMDAYLAGKNLLMPTGMGERFQVLALARDAPTDPPLPGFRPDLMPGPSRR